MVFKRCWGEGVSVCVCVLVNCDMLRAVIRLNTQASRTERLNGAPLEAVYVLLPLLLLLLLLLVVSRSGAVTI